MLVSLLPQPTELNGHYNFATFCLFPGSFQKAMNEFAQKVCLCKKRPISMKTKNLIDLYWLVVAAHNDHVQTDFSPAGKRIHFSK